MLQFGSSIHSLTNMNMERRELQSKKREDLGKFKRRLHVITFYETAIGLNIGGSSLDDVRTPQCILLLLLCFVLITNGIVIFWFRESRQVWSTSHGETLLNVDKSGRHAVAFDSGVNDRNKTKGRIFSLHTAIKFNYDSGYLIRKGN